MAAPVPEIAERAVGESRGVATVGSGEPPSHPFVIEELPRRISRFGHSIRVKQHEIAFAQLDFAIRVRRAGFEPEHESTLVNPFDAPVGAADQQRRVTGIGYGDCPAVGVDVASSRYGHATRDNNRGLHYSFKTGAKAEILLVMGDATFTQERLEMDRSALSSASWTWNEWSVANAGGDPSLTTVSWKPASRNSPGRPPQLCADRTRTSSASDARAAATVGRYERRAAHARRWPPQE